MADSDTNPTELVKRRGTLSFMSVTKTRRGRTVSYCEFDVPDESYRMGYYTGVLAAHELLEALRRGAERVRPTASMIAAAVAHEATKARAYDEANAHGAAVGFMSTLAEALRQFASTDGALEGFHDRRMERRRLQLAAVDAANGGQDSPSPSTDAQQRSTADVIAMPGAAATPAPNPRGRGRYPQGVASLAAHRRQKAAAHASGGRPAR